MAAAAETRQLAAALRDALRRTYPGAAMQVRAGRTGHRDYIHVRWTDGPALNGVQVVADRLATSAVEGAPSVQPLCLRSYSAAMLRRIAQVWARGFGRDVPEVVDLARGGPTVRFASPSDHRGFWDVAAAMGAATAGSDTEAA